MAGELSAAHAAHVVATGGVCTDPQAERLLVPPVARINTRLANEAIDVGKFWTSYLSEVAQNTDLSDACARSLAWAGCNELQLDATAGALTKELSEARSVFNGRYPKLTDQLELRGQPLRQRWNALGVGILREVERLIWENSPPSDWWPDRVEGVLVQPVSRGRWRVGGS